MIFAHNLAEEIGLNFIMLNNLKNIYIDLNVILNFNINLNYY